VARNQRFSATGRNGPPTPPNPGGARAAALALVARRDYTAAELERKLEDKGYDASVIADTIAGLGASGIIDDRRVAAAHVRTATRVKSRGRVRIARELAARGVPEEIVKDVLAEATPGDELASIRRILVRKRWPARPSRAERQRMFRHLLGRGFPADTISRALGGHESDDGER
jgi:regulatory protein